jgi:uncharacterized protein (DUF433 family)
MTETAPMPQDKLVCSHPDILGGAHVFAGTRVPVKALWDYLEGGLSLDEFLDHFPAVSRNHALAVLDLAHRKVITDASAA